MIVHAAVQCVLVLVVGAVFVAAGSAGTKCPGDCDGDGAVAVNELVQAVNITLELADADLCSAADADANGAVSIAELVVAVNRLLNGCDTSSPTPTSPKPTAEPTPPPTVTATPSASRAPTVDPTDVPTTTATPDPSLPPTNQIELVEWLQAGSYLGWPAEGGRHPGSGPHFGAVRTFVNDTLFASLDDNGSTHPAGAAAVKELFGSGSTVRGWAVAIKPGAGDRGNAWYWLEYYNGRVLAQGFGNTSCTGCHAAGTDYVCTPFPLQPGGQSVPARCP